MQSNRNKQTGALLLSNYSTIKLRSFIGQIKFFGPLIESTCLSAIDWVENCSNNDLICQCKQSIRFDQQQK